ncbi:hypothetical protein OC709_02400 ['Planchonia careya' phytoplasma]|nr:hypothetical protein ['Planchonia careya' phytoplasma]
MALGCEGILLNKDLAQHMALLISGLGPSSHFIKERPCDGIRYWQLVASRSLWHFIEEMPSHDIRRCRLVALGHQDILLKKDLIMMKDIAN